MPVLVEKVLKWCTHPMSGEQNLKGSDWGKTVEVNLRQKFMVLEEVI